MKKIVLLLLVFTTTGCASGKWAWEMTEAEKKLERLEGSHLHKAPPPLPYGYLELIGAILQVFTESHG